MIEIQFLSTDDVIALHEDTLEHEGGRVGLKDFGMVDSAVHMPRQMFGGEYLHPTMASMAAAYMFHLACNHGFTDGNKRVGVLAAFTFLYENGIEFQPPEDELEAAALAVASHQMSKAELIEWFERRWPG